MNYPQIPGAPHSASEEETIALIRSVLTEDDFSESASNPPLRIATENDRQQTDDTLEPNPREKARRERSAFVELHDAEVEPVKRSKLGSLMGAPSRLLSALKGEGKFRPTVRQLAIASALLLVVVRPIWFVVGIFVALAVVLGVFMSLGQERVCGAILRHLKRVEAKNPERAANLQRRLDNFAYHWDKILDRLPDGTVDRLYMPDFHLMAQADERHTDAMSERLKRMEQEGAPIRD